MVAVWAVLAISAQASSPLEGLEAEYASYTKSSGFDYAKLSALNTKVIEFVESNQPTTADEFIRCSNLIYDFRFRFRVSRVKHELCLAALAMGDSRARSAIKKSWDGLVIASGRPQRIGSFKFAGYEKYNPSYAPKSILSVFSDPDKALTRAQTMKSDAEVTKICDADQAVRKQDWSKLSSKQMKEITVQDNARKKQIIRLLAQGRVVTAEDFDHASLVLQHGETWADYCLAHELSICSLLLGRKEAAWLASATYDRMLGAGGYAQRFATQYSSDGNGPISLDPVDTTGISDSVRRAMHCPTLEQARNRKWD